MNQERRFKLLLSPEEMRHQQNRVNNDHYDLVDALRPTDLAVHLEKVGLGRSDPVLLTYKGRESGHIERFTLNAA